VTWTAVPLGQFRFLSGEINLGKFESDPGIRWGFCRECGSSMIYESDDTPEKIYITVANLSGPMDREPEGHVSYEESVPWIHGAEHLPRYRGKTDQRI
jgi:hypothetical protein